MHAKIVKKKIVWDLGLDRLSKIIEKSHVIKLVN